MTDQTNLNNPYRPDMNMKPEEPKEDITVEEVQQDNLTSPDQIDESIFDVGEEDTEATNSEVEDTPDAEIKVYDVDENHVETPDAVIKTFKTKLKELTDDERENAISLVKSTQESLLACLSLFKGLQPNATEEETNAFLKWVKYVDDAQKTFMLSEDQLIDAVTRKGSHWVNMVNTNKKAGENQAPVYRGPVVDRKGLNPIDKDDNRSLAFNIMTSILKVGSPCYIFLYHTGIWLRLRTPTAAEFALLDEAYVSEKLEYGALTRGLIFSNDYVILRSLVYDFILDHVTFSTAPSDDPEYLRSIIKVTDIDEMMRGIMQTRYPDGYPYIESCTVNPNKCTHQVEGILDLREISWADETMLTEYQLNIMHNARRRITEEELQRYQEEFTSRQQSRIAFRPDGEEGEDGVDIMDADNVINGIVLNIETPTLERDRDYGVKLIYQLKGIVENIFKEKFDAEMRNKRLNELVAVSFFKVYGSWVKSIEIYKAGNLILKEEQDGELNKMFDFLSSDSEHVDRFITMIKKYISNTIVQVVGIKNHECPACHGKVNTKEGNHYLILPMDMLSTFFTLIQSSVRRSIR